MIHIYGSTKNNADYSNYLSVISLACDEQIINIMFKQLADYLNKVHKFNSVHDLLSDNEIIRIFKDDIIKGIDGDENKFYFSFNIISKEYVRFMAYFSEQLEDEKLNSYARVKSLDDIFGGIDSNILKKFPDLTDNEMNNLNNNVNKLLGEKKHYKSQEVFTRNLLNYKYNEIEKEKYSNSHLLESTYYIWYVNNIIESHEDESNYVLTYSIGKDELSTYMSRFNASNPVHSPLFTVDDVPNDNIFAAVGFFLDALNKIVLSALENEIKFNIDDDLYKQSKYLFNEIWSVVRKDLSVWMISSEKYKELQSLVSDNSEVMRNY